VIAEEQVTMQRVEESDKSEKPEKATDSRQNAAPARQHDAKPQQ